MDAEMTVTLKVKDMDDPNLDAYGRGDTVVIMDFTANEELTSEKTCKEITNCVQKMRKDAKLTQNDSVDMWAMGEGDGYISKLLKERSEFLEGLLRRPLWDANLLQGHELVVRSEEFSIEDTDGKKQKLKVTITSTAPFFNSEAMKKLTAGDAKAELCAQQFVQTCTLKKMLDAKKTPLQVSYDGKTLSLKYGEHWALGPTDAT